MLYRSNHELNQQPSRSYVQTGSQPLTTNYRETAPQFRPNIPEVQVNNYRQNTFMPPRPQKVVTQDEVTFRGNVQPKVVSNIYSDRNHENTFVSRSSA